MSFFSLKELELLLNTVNLVSKASFLQLTIPRVIGLPVIARKCILVIAPRLMHVDRNQLNCTSEV